MPRALLLVHYLRIFVFFIFSEFFLSFCALLFIRMASCLVYASKGPVVEASGAEETDEEKPARQDDKSKQDKSL